MQYDRRPHRQDTLELREHEEANSRMYHHQQQHHQHHQQQHYADHEGQSIMEDDSADEQDNDFIDEEDDGSSSLSIPNESIDFDLVYSLHTFVATVEGQANVVKGDSLSLMDDSNSYWWLVRVLKTQEIGYIPAENIETPFERLARLNKHRNVDLASATQAERQEDIRATRERLRAAMHRTTSPSSAPSAKSVVFTGSSVFHYPPAVWGDEIPEDDGWDEEEYGSYDENDEYENGEQAVEGMEPDDGMSWEDGAAEEEQERKLAIASQQQRAAAPSSNIPASLRPGSGAGSQHVQHQQLQTQQAVSTPAQQHAQLGLGHSPSRQQARDRPAQEPQQSASNQRAYIDPADVSVTKTISLTPPIVRGPEADTQSQQTRVRSSQSTASVAQSQGHRSSSSQQTLARTTSGGSQGSAESSKRSRDDVNGNESDVSESSRKKGKKGSEKDKQRKAGRSTPVDNAEESGKESGRESGRESGNESRDKKKKSGMFGGLFSSKKKDKKDKESRKPDQDTASTGSTGRISEESQVTASPQQDTQNSQGFVNGNRKPANSTDPRRTVERTQQPAPAQIQTQTQTQTQPNGAPLSQHGLRMQRADLQQQALYQQHVSRSPTGTVPDAASAFGLQTAASQGRDLGNNNLLTPSTPFNGTGGRNRPGSLILAPGSLDGALVPELSVMRVFAGDRLQSEATFKTVLLNQSTTAGELVRQAIQRFRLAHGEDERDYYLTVKQLDGDEAELGPDENPLGLWEELVESAMNIPTIKRSSISSISSNLSAHPAITKLGMNDFTDDSTVKFYLNRRSSRDDSSTIHARSETTATSPSESNTASTYRTAAEDSIILNDTETSRTSSPDPIAQALGKLSGKSTPPNPNAGTLRPHLHIATGPSIVAERFSSPTVRFAVQLVIYPEDLPEGMVFDPHTEAIVPKYTLQSRNHMNGANGSGVSMSYRKKVFVFPKNTTVAEVIESGLERFGIVEGVVDGGDEVEDKMTKRRASSRVRYGLAVQQNGDIEVELQPSSKILEAFARPPAFRHNDRRSSDLRRRSLDSSQMLGSLDDVQSGDPVFVLRRAATYRASMSKHRLSSALDEVSLRQNSMQRESTSSERSAASDYTQLAESPPPILPPTHQQQQQQQPQPQPQQQQQKQQMSRQELIAAQREASRANQLALLSAQKNSEQGVDLVLPDKGLLRSTRSSADERMRYSYIQPDGETYDISEIIEEEWWDVRKDTKAQRGVAQASGLSDTMLSGRAHSGTHSPDAGRYSPVTSRNDLLQGVAMKPRDDLEKRIDRVLSKINDGKRSSRLLPVQSNSSPQRADSPPVHTNTPSPSSVAHFLSKHPQRSATPEKTSSSPTPEPASWSRPQPTKTNDRPGHSHQPSLGSVMSDLSTNDTPTPSKFHADTQTPPLSTPPPRAPSPVMQPMPVILKDDFGLTKMLAVIELAANAKKPPPPRSLSTVDELLFGPNMSIGDLHPSIRDIYEPSFRQLEDINMELDALLRETFKLPS